MKKRQEDKTKKRLRVLTWRIVETTRHISYGQTNVRKEGEINAKRKKRHTNKRLATRLVLYIPTKLRKAADT